MKQKKYIAIAMFGVSVILSVIGLYFCPENIVVQWNSAGEGQNVISKYFALIIGLCCGAFGGWYWYGKDRSALTGAWKYLWKLFDYILGCIGIIVISVFLIMNLL